MAPARRATANVEAPVWKSYLAVRVGEPAKPIAPTTSGLSRTRKRAKPSISFSSTSPEPLGVGESATKLQLATRASVRSYWEALGLQGRLQILMVDHPELVKQLYKLNLSLLCVGLMQRHLKTSATKAVATGTTSDVAASTTTAVVPSEASSDPRLPSTAQVESTTATASAPASIPAPAASTDLASSAERTYDLLEAMEFMDIGTGILTVKTELVEDVERMFSLMSAVLPGFLMTIHVLSESQFHDLFVSESEVINTWEDYERLIAMLVEQLILRSYVAHLEKEATQQMEALLLEATLEENGAAATGKADMSNKKKKKKKKKPKPASKPLAKPEEVRDTETAHAVQDGSESEPEEEGVLLAMEEMDIEMEEEFTCHSECSTEDADLSGPSSPVKSLSKSLSKSLAYVLNPHAQVFQPAPLANEELKSPIAGKRKLDDFIIHIPWQDLQDENEDEDDLETDVYDDVEVHEDIHSNAEELSCRRARETHSEHDNHSQQHRRRRRRREQEDAELQWHLQHMYASTSSMFGWDFLQQREVAMVPPSSCDPWNDVALWRTDPRDVVRYYFPPPPPSQHHHHHPPNGFGMGILPPPPVAAASTATGTAPSSRYYFTPPDTAATPSIGQTTRFPPFLPPPVSFWDENAIEHDRATFAELLEPQGFPKFHHPQRSSPRPAKRR